MQAAPIKFHDWGKVERRGNDPSTLSAVKYNDYWGHYVQAGYPFTFYLYATVGTSMIARNLALT